MLVFLHSGTSLWLLQVFASLPLTAFVPLTHLSVSSIGRTVVSGFFDVVVVDVVVVLGGVGVLVVVLVVVVASVVVVFDVVVVGGLKVVVCVGL